KTARLLAVNAKQILMAMSAADRDRHTALQRQLKEFDGRKPRALPVAPALQEVGLDAPKTFLLRRGELTHPGEEVRAGFPIILSPNPSPPPAPIKVRPAGTGRRAALADWLTSPANPLTARVLVNRLWQHHFGRGIVPSASDFGLRGQPPTHPELL